MSSSCASFIKRPVHHGANGVRIGVAWAVLRHVSSSCARGATASGRFTFMPAPHGRQSDGEAPPANYGLRRACAPAEASARRGARHFEASR